MDTLDGETAQMLTDTARSPGAWAGDAGCGSRGWRWGARAASGPLAAKLAVNAVVAFHFVI